MEALPHVLGQCWLQSPHPYLYRQLSDSVLMRISKCHLLARFLPARLPGEMWKNVNSGGEFIASMQPGVMEGAM